MKIETPNKDSTTKLSINLSGAIVTASSKKNLLVDVKTVNQVTLSLQPQAAELESVFGALDDYLLSYPLPTIKINNIKLICEEVFINIASHSGTTDNISLTLAHNQTHLFIQFDDQGLPFDPCSDDEKISDFSNIEDIKIGGLGITMVKKMSDELFYQREGDTNHFFILITL